MENSEIALWQNMVQQHEKLSQLLAEPGLSQDKRQQYQKLFHRISLILEQKRVIEQLEQKRDSLQKEAADFTDPEMIELYKLEDEDLVQQLDRAHQELEDVMYPADEHDNRSVYLEIRAGAGGQEAALFVADLLKTYTNYALRKGWRVSVESAQDTDLGGYREAVLYIQGQDVYGHLKHESGVHRVQRVPATETAGRIHTSTVTVAVLPEAKEVDVSINPADLRIDVYRASGAGGQHVNTTDSAVRITHVPTGVVVACQDERSQHKNKAKALKLLQSRILAAQMERDHAERSSARREQVGSGMRAEKVRTYNYPQNRITDHQVDVTLKNLDVVMQSGDLDEIIGELRKKERVERKKQAFMTTLI